MIWLVTRLLVLVLGLLMLSMALLVKILDWCDADYTTRTLYRVVQKVRRDHGCFVCRFSEAYRANHRDAGEDL